MTLKEHACPTCGANLKLDIDKQMYECTFCGSTFDYEYFAEDSVLEIADKALMMGEFVSATDAYRFMLQKEPSNFEALRGKILSSLRYKGISAFSDTKTYLDINYKTADEHVDNAIENCRPEHREYFKTMKDMFDSGKTYKKETETLNDLQDERKSLNNGITGMNEAQYRYYSTWTKPEEAPENAIIVNPKTSLIITVVIYIIWAVIIGIFFIFAENPYAKDAVKITEETVETTRARNYNIIFPPVSSGDGSKINNGTRRYTVISGDSIKAMNDYSKKAKEEKKRKENYIKWERDHKDDTTKAILLLTLPLAVVAIRVAVLIGRMLRIKEINRSIAHQCDLVSEVSKKITEHEKALHNAREEILKNFRALKKLDPLTQQ